MVHADAYLFYAAVRLPSHKVFGNSIAARGYWGCGVFDPSSSLEENLLAFKAACDEIDADCAKILFDNLDILKMYGADRQARSQFDARVKKALEELPDDEPGT